MHSLQITVVKAAEGGTIWPMPDAPNFLEAFEGDSPLFEDSGRPNGIKTWSARALAEFLGYKDYGSFKTVLNRTQQALISIDTDVSEHVRQEVTIDGGGRKKVDLRLSRFACYLAAMNGDQGKLEGVAEEVGKMVRTAMDEISGQKPENLPAHEDIRKVRLGFKQAGEIIKTTPLHELEDEPSPPLPGEFIEASDED